MAITQADRDAAENRIREKILNDGWPEPQTEEEFRYAVPRIWPLRRAHQRLG